MGNKVAEMVADRIIEQLEKGVIPWRKPWVGVNKPINYVSRKAYRGVNLLLLDQPGEWLTFKQCEAAGGKVKKGEKGSLVVYYSSYEKAVKDADGNDSYTADGALKLVTIPVLKYSTVFHISQCEGIESKIKDNNCNSVIAKPESVIANYISENNISFNMIKGSDRAFYAPSRDEINVPDIQQFVTANEYYATVFHEMVHSTGHESRLKRFTDGKAAAFGDESYSKEELIAEIGSAMLIGNCGIETSNTFNNSAAYIGSWLKALKDDKSMVINAASKAAKAVDFIMGKESSDV